MADIYRSGVGGVIYLGGETTASARIVETLNLLHSENRCTIHGFEGDSETVPSGGSRPSRHLAALKDLYSREWFSRTWVVQEAILPKTSIVILGSLVLSLEKVLCVTQGLSDGSAFQDDFVFRAEYLALLIDHLRSSPSDNFLATSMGLLVKGLRFQDVSDPPDKIYGLLRLCSRLEELPGLLVPDYDRPVRDVYRDAARFLIQSSEEGLGVLRQVRHIKKPDTSATAFPSWVPFWDRSGSYANDQGSLLSYHTDHSAHANTIVETHLATLGDLDVLEVSGLLIDTIVYTDDSFQPAHLAHSDDGLRVRHLVNRVTQLLGVDRTSFDGFGRSLCSSEKESRKIGPKTRLYTTSLAIWHI
ncbi:hypothetical protein LTR74_012531 [Friedmanniomyces endolithicus]|nr:hypothetical protein LTR74_012531 [Friedmanniomyces endolithicus]